MTDLITSSNAPQNFEMGGKDMSRFRRLAERYGVTAIPIRDRTSKENIYNIIVRGEDAEQVNLIFHKMGHAAPAKEVDEKNAPTHAPQEKESPKRGMILAKGVK